jgi:AraC-like DNA-binding protein
MNYCQIPPPPALTNFVQYFWVLEGSASSGQPFRHRAIADICPEFIFYYKGSFNLQTAFPNPTEKLPSGLYGQFRNYKRFATVSDYGIFGVYLYPYAIPCFFHLPTSELTEQQVDIKTLCGREGEILEEKILSAKNNFERVSILSDFLMCRLNGMKKQDEQIIASINNIIHNRQAPSIAKLSDECYLSRRQFERKFGELAGLSPRVFLNIVKVNRAINHYLKLEKTLTQVAYECGYYDQSHFIHDFKSFSGLSPKEYFRANENCTDYRALSDSAI